MSRDLQSCLPRLLKARAAVLWPLHHEIDITEGGVLSQAGQHPLVQSPHHRASIIIVTILNLKKCDY